MPARPQSRPIVANNTPLVALWLLDRLELLRDLYESVLIPDAVQQEFLATQRVIRENALKRAPWIESTRLQTPQRALAFAGLDRGEAEVLALAEEREARLVIIDERRGRMYAQRLGLRLTGTLGVLVLAKERGLVDRVAPLVEDLKAGGLYLAPDIVARALELAGES